MLIGENIPFRKLGFSSLEAFIQTVPGIKITNKNGCWFVEARATEDTMHLARLISQQKTSCGKSKKKASYKKPFIQVRRPRPQPVRSYPKVTYNVNPSPSITCKPLSSLQNFPRENGIKTDKSSHKNIPSLVNMHITPPALPPQERSRYMQLNSSGPTSPSKRLKDKQTNGISPPIKQEVDMHTRLQNLVKEFSVITQKPKTVSLNIETPKIISTPQTRKYPDLSERLRITNSTAESTPEKKVPKCELLSPLSPGQLLAEESENVSIADSIVIHFRDRVVPMLSMANQDFKNELEICSRLLKLSAPVYKISETPISKKSKISAVFANVKVGTHGYTSFPYEARMEEEAQQVAAKAALIDLNEKYGMTRSCPITTDSHQFKNNISELVKAHPNGIFVQQITWCYKQKYNENIPLNWESLLKECPGVTLEKGVNNSTILIAAPQQQATKARDRITSTKPVQLSPLGPLSPEPFKCPEEDAWMIFVTCAENTEEIWVTLFDDPYKIVLDELDMQMKDHYEHSKDCVIAQQVEINHYYAVCDEDKWLRVRCLEYDPATKEATVLFIDCGYAGVYHQKKLYVLERRFYSIPIQAIKLNLHGLEDFSECEEVMIYVEKYLCDRPLYIEVIERRLQEDGISSATAVFYDTHGPEDVDLNKVIAKEILTAVVKGPMLNTDGEITEVFVSHVENNGDVFIQKQSESMKCLLKLLNRLTQTRLTEEDQKRCVVSSIDTTYTYFVSYEGNWYRGVVVNICANNQVKMFLIDFGKIITVGRSSLIQLMKLSEMLAKFPAQALKVRLHNIDQTAFNVEKLNELAPRGEVLILKVISSLGGTPVVELFKRVESTKMLVSINTSLQYQTYEEGSSKVNGDGNNNIKKPKRILTKTHSSVDENDGRCLKPPTISEIGEYFDVHVTMAANPGNFTVQPFDNTQGLVQMMGQLQQVCRTYEGPPIQPETIKEGRLYAGLHIDGDWYRVYVTKFLNSNFVPVYFVDFGDNAVLSVDKLQPLRKQFWDLPYQAIKARLVGIHPTNVDWSVEDCIRFQELVVDRNFVSIVMEAEINELSPSKTVYGLKLIDVDTSEDIYIDELLIQEGRAIRD
ncbi:tudor domain-containing protein 7-like isoform X2 [Prorops nasuta]